MKKVKYKIPPQIHSQTSPDADEGYLSDVFDMLTEHNQGHMECWEYSTAQYSGDPAGGGHFWAQLICNPGSYYLVEEEKLLVKQVLKFSSENFLNNIRTVIELGPGSINSLENKTIPFLRGSSSINTYIAVDSEASQAQFATQYVEKNTNISRTISCHKSFKDFSLNTPRLEPSALVMWGGTIGNIPGNIGADSRSPLIKSLSHYNEILASGDYMLITFDTQENEQEILNAYNQPLMSACFLSTLHRLVRDNLVSGDFDPNQWRHESIWIPGKMQCAHTLFPVVDQNFTLNAHKVHIPRFKRFVTNNSYKFKAETMKQVAAEAGFVPQIIQNGPMAMLIAKKI